MQLYFVRGDMFRLIIQPFSVAQFYINDCMFCKCLLKRFIEEKIKEEMEVTIRRGKRRRKLLHDLKDRRVYSHLKEKALDRTMWRNGFGGGFGPVVIQITE